MKCEDKLQITISNNRIIPQRLNAPPSTGLSQQAHWKHTVHYRISRGDFRNANGTQLSSNTVDFRVQRSLESEEV